MTTPDTKDRAAAAQPLHQTASFQEGGPMMRLLQQQQQQQQQNNNNCKSNKNSKREPMGGTNTVHHAASTAAGTAASVPSKSAGVHATTESGGSRKAVGRLRAKQLNLYHNNKAGNTAGSNASASGNAGNGHSHIQQQVLLQQQQKQPQTPSQSHEPPASYQCDTDNNGPHQKNTNVSSNSSCQSGNSSNHDDNNSVYHDCVPAPTTSNSAQDTTNNSAQTTPSTPKKGVIPISHVNIITQAYGSQACIYKDVLQIPPDLTSERDIRIAYFRRGRQVLAEQQPGGAVVDTPKSGTTTSSSADNHKGGVSHLAKLKFQAVSMAYEVLSNPSWKASYDQYGWGDDGLDSYHEEPPGLTSTLGSSSSVSNNGDEDHEQENSKESARDVAARPQDITGHSVSTFAATEKFSPAAKLRNLRMGGASAMNTSSKITNINTSSKSNPPPPAQSPPNYTGMPPIRPTAPSSSSPASSSKKTRNKVKARIVSPAGPLVSYINSNGNANGNVRDNDNASCVSQSTAGTNTSRSSVLRKPGSFLEKLAKQKASLRRQSSNGGIGNGNAVSSVPTSMVRWNEEVEELIFRQDPDEISFKVRSAEEDDDYQTASASSSQSSGGSNSQRSGCTVSTGSSNGAPYYAVTENQQHQQECRIVYQKEPYRTEKSGGANTMAGPNHPNHSNSDRKKSALDTAELGSHLKKLDKVADSIADIFDELEASFDGMLGVGLSNGTPSNTLTGDRGGNDATGTVKQKLQMLQQKQQQQYLDRPSSGNQKISNNNNKQSLPPTSWSSPTRQVNHSNSNTNNHPGAMNQQIQQQHWQGQQQEQQQHASARSTPHQEQQLPSSSAHFGRDHLAKETDQGCPEVHLAEELRKDDASYHTPPSRFRHVLEHASGMPPTAIPEDLNLSKEEAEQIELQAMALLREVTAMEVTALEGAPLMDVVIKNKKTRRHQQQLQREDSPSEFGRKGGVSPLSGQQANYSGQDQYEEAGETRSFCESEMGAGENATVAASVVSLLEPQQYTNAPLKPAATTSTTGAKASRRRLRNLQRRRQQQRAKEQEQLEQLAEENNNTAMAPSYQHDSVQEEQKLYADSQEKPKKGNKKKEDQYFESLYQNFFAVPKERSPNEMTIRTRPPQSSSCSVSTMSYSAATTATPDLRFNPWELANSAWMRQENHDDNVRQIQKDVVEMSNQERLLDTTLDSSFTDDFGLDSTFDSETAVDTTFDSSLADSAFTSASDHHEAEYTVPPTTALAGCESTPAAFLNHVFDVPLEAPLEFWCGQAKDAASTIASRKKDKELDYRKQKKLPLPVDNGTNDKVSIDLSSDILDEDGGGGSPNDESMTLLDPPTHDSRMYAGASIACDDSTLNTLNTNHFEEDTTSRPESRPGSNTSSSQPSTDSRQSMEPQLLPCEPTLGAEATGRERGRSRELVSVEPDSESQCVRDRSRELVSVETASESQFVRDRSRELMSVETASESQFVRDISTELAYSVSTAALDELDDLREGISPDTTSVPNFLPENGTGTSEPGTDAADSYSTMSVLAAPSSLSLRRAGIDTSMTPQEEDSIDRGIQGNISSGTSVFSGVSTENEDTSSFVAHLIAYLKNINVENPSLDCVKAQMESGLESLYASNEACMNAIVVSDEDMDGMLDILHLEMLRSTPSSTPKTAE